ncbi:MAG: metallophosphoesterase family protein [Pseudomonadota bacterium]
MFASFGLVFLIFSATCQQVKVEISVKVACKNIPNKIIFLSIRTLLGKTMIKAGIISDTHGNIGLFSEIMVYLNDTIKIDKLYHLGDNFSDPDKIKTDAQIIKVPGLYCPEYDDLSIAKIAYDKLFSANICLVHNKEILLDEDIDSTQILLFGHTHKYYVGKENGMFFINPGHLKDKFHRDQIATFGILEIEDKQFCITILDKDFRIKEMKRYFI